MQRILIVLVAFFFSCKTNQPVVVQGNDLEIMACGPTPLKEQTSKIVFQSGTEEFLEDYTTEIIAISDIIKKIPKNYLVEISGHTDSVGDKDLNLVLSQKRAEKIRKLLVAQGCEASKLVSKGYGETRPLVSNKTKNGRQQNRRIEIIVIEK